MRLFIILASLLAKFGEFDRKGTLPPSPPRDVDWVFVVGALLLFACFVLALAHGAHAVTPEDLGVVR